MRSGWLVVVGRFYPGGPSERSECESRAPSEACSKLAVAELSPTDQWTTPQALPGSRGFGASAAEPVELSGRRIELAWEQGQPQVPTIRVAVGRLGGGLGRPHIAQRLMRSEPENEMLENYAGQILVRGEFGNSPARVLEHTIERRLYPDGSLGRPLFRQGDFLSPANGERFPQLGGGETLVFSGGDWAGFAVRTARAASYRRSHVFSKHAYSGINSAANRRGHVLVVLRAWEHSVSRLMAAEISPQGVLEATEVLETGPTEPEVGYQFEGKLGPSGQELVISTDAARHVWVYAAAAACRRFSRTELPLTEGEFPRFFVGAGGVFHLVWIDHAGRAVRTSAVRVECRR